MNARAVLAIALGALALASCSAFDPNVGPLRDAGGACTPRPEQPDGGYGSPSADTGDDAENYCPGDT